MGGIGGGEGVGNESSEEGGGAAELGGGEHSNMGDNGLATGRGQGDGGCGLEVRGGDGSTGGRRSWVDQGATGINGLTHLPKVPISPQRWGGSIGVASCNSVIPPPSPFPSPLLLRANPPLPPRQPMAKRTCPRRQSARRGAAAQSASLKARTSSPPTSLPPSSPYPLLLQTPPRPCFFHGKTYLPKAPISPHKCGGSIGVASCTSVISCNT